MPVLGFPFDIDDCKIALYNATDDYGTAQDVKAISQATMNVQTVNAELPGDASIVDTHARGVSVTVNVRFGFYELAVYEILTGLTVTAGTSRESMKVTNFNPPYFGIAFQMKMTDGTQDQHIFIPKAKIMEGFSLSGAYGEYQTPELTIKGILDSTYGLFTIVRNEAITSLVIPPVLT